MPPLEAPSDYSPAFILGVTGHMDLDPAFRPNVEALVRRTLDWVRSPAKTKDSILGPGLGLVKTPVLLLSSLAPGADQWVAIVAQEMGVRVLAPLPFLKDQYLRSSTFQKDGRVINGEATRFFTHFPDDRTFLVRLLDEVDLADEALRRKHEPLLTGPEHKQARDRRFAAAGEYVAAYSDILLALTNKPIGQPETIAIRPGMAPGARTIAEMKRRGPTPGVLPVQPSLNWTDNGPVIHLFAWRKSEAAAVLDPANPPAELEVLYPYDCRPKGVHENDSQNRAWQEAGRKLLYRTARHLEQFNHEPAPRDEAKEKGELSEAFLEMDSFLSDENRSLPEAEHREHHREFRRNLDRIARIRRRAATYNAHYDARFKEQKRLLFHLAFYSALFFALADDWQVDNDRLWWLRCVFFLLALLTTSLAWLVYFWRVRKSEAGQRCDDYRAIAEGLRVQLYWTVCGSGESVASNYLQRQRGELAWIRNVISSVAFPYEENRLYFRQLSFGSQLAVLERIRVQWLEEQTRFFEKSVTRLTAAKATCSEVSKNLLWTGFLLTIHLFGAPWLNPTSLPAGKGDWCVGAGGLLLGLAWLWRRRGERRSNAKGVEVLSPTREHRNQVTSYLLVAASCLCSIGIGLLLGQSRWWMPDANKVTGILKTVALASGALLGAWMSVNFFTENIHRYTSMISLFEGASQRLKEHLQSIEAASEDEKGQAHQKSVIDIQRMLIAVGKEALVENAEWLMVHRTRPLEPLNT